MRQSLPMRGLNFDLIRLRQRGEQRLRLGDLGHLGRRREAFDRGREDGVGFGGAAGRLVELGERERGEQLVASRGLLFRDGDRRSICVFGGGDVRGGAFEQNVAAKAVQEGEGGKVRGFIRADQCFIDACDRAAAPNVSSSVDPRAAPERTRQGAARPY